MYRTSLEVKGQVHHVVIAYQQQFIHIVSVLCDEILFPLSEGVAGGRLYSPRGSLGYTGLGAGLEGWNTLHGRRGSGGRRRGRIGMGGGCDGSRLLLVACVVFCPCKNLKRRRRDHQR